MVNFAFLKYIPCTVAYQPPHSPGKKTGVGCHFLLQEIFPTQGLNSGLPHCRQMLYNCSRMSEPRGKLLKYTLRKYCPERDSNVKWLYVGDLNRLPPVCWIMIVIKPICILVLCNKLHKGKIGKLICLSVARCIP